MRRMPPRLRLRRGAWRGSTKARLAAACLVSVALLLSLPAPAAGFPCGEGPHSAVPARHLASVRQQSAADCTTPGNRRKPQRTRKKGSVSGLTVFVLALGGALLIPIGRNGLPRSFDPYGHDRPF
jgi:hypothetical protein